MKVYFDGVQVYEDPQVPQPYPYSWATTTVLFVPSDVRTLSIGCLNFVVGSHGIIASTSDGLMTDGIWKCTANQSGFPLNPATIVAQNGAAPWGLRYKNGLLVTNHILSLSGLASQLMPSGSGQVVTQHQCGLDAAYRSNYRLTCDILGLELADRTDLK